jgi:hypothetical protein
MQNLRGSDTPWGMSKVENSWKHKDKEKMNGRHKSEGEVT